MHLCQNSNWCHKRNSDHLQNIEKGSRVTMLPLCASLPSSLFTLIFHNHRSPMTFSLLKIKRKTQCSLPLIRYQQKPVSCAAVATAWQTGSCMNQLDRSSNHKSKPNHIRTIHRKTFSRFLGGHLNQSSSSQIF